jgi:hypothetical protein
MTSPRKTSDASSPHAEPALTNSMQALDAAARAGDFTAVLQAVMALPLDQGGYAQIDGLLQRSPAVSNPQFSWSKTVHILCAVRANLLDLDAKVQARIQTHRSSAVRANLLDLDAKVQARAQAPRSTRSTADTRCSEPSEEQDQALLVRIQQMRREVDDMIEAMVWI